MKNWQWKPLGYSKTVLTLSWGLSQKRPGNTLFALTDHRTRQTGSRDQFHVNWKWGATFGWRSRRRKVFAGNQTTWNLSGQELTGVTAEALHAIRRNLQIAMALRRTFEKQAHDAHNKQSLPKLCKMSDDDFHIHQHLEIYKNPSTDGQRKSLYLVMAYYMMCVVHMFIGSSWKQTTGNN